MRLYRAQFVGKNQLPRNFRMLVSGPTGSGKTSFVEELIQSDRVEKKFENIYYCYPDHFEEPPVQWDNWPDVIVHYIPFIPDISFIKTIKKDSLLVFDDNYDQIIKNSAISSAMKIYARRNFSVIIITQFYYENGTFSRVIRNQMNAVVLFPNFGDSSMNKTIAKQLGVSTQFNLAKKETENRKYDPIVILSNEIVSTPELRVQTRYLTQYPYCYK